MEKVSGIVLAGGRSSRMGTDKAGLRIGGKTFLRWQADKLRALGISDLMLSGAAERLPGTRTVPDIYPDRGPLGGLHACLTAAENPACLVLTVDMPLLPGEVLAKLVRQHLAERPDVTALELEGRMQPLAAVYSSRLAGPAEALIRERARPVRALLDLAEVRTLAYTGPAEYALNCNTPQDYETVLSLLKKFPAP